MKTHAVPHEIMAVEFKLFGNFMSLREFIFIAVGLAMAYFFYLLMNSHILPAILAIPAMLIFGLGGTLIGILPIDERPLDKWIMNYLSAIRQPTQRVWQKPGYSPQTVQSDVFTTKDHLVSSPSSRKTTIFAAGSAVQKRGVDTASLTAEKNEETDLAQIEQHLTALEKTTPVPVVPVLSPTHIAQTVKPISPTVGHVSFQTTPAPQTATPSDTITPAHPATAPTPPQASVPDPEDIPEQPRPPEPPHQEAYIPAGSTKVINIDDNNIKSYTTSITSLESNPNTINIVVKDSNGLILPGVVCVIKNAHGDPVRAAISNILGQILNNIPLKNGVYKVNLNKQGYVFPEITRSLRGDTYPPIEIKSL